MLKFKTLCAVLAYLSSNWLLEVGLSLFRYFEVDLGVCDIVVKKSTFAISSPDEFLYTTAYKPGTAVLPHRPKFIGATSGDGFSTLIHADITSAAVSKRPRLAPAVPYRRIRPAHLHAIHLHYFQHRCLV